MRNNVYVTENRNAVVVGYVCRSQKLRPHAVASAVEIGRCLPKFISGGTFPALWGLLGSIEKVGLPATPATEICKYKVHVHGGAAPLLSSPTTGLEFRRCEPTNHCGLEF